MAFPLLFNEILGDSIELEAVIPLENFDALHRHIQL